MQDWIARPLTSTLPVHGHTKHTKTCGPYCTPPLPVGTQGRVAGGRDCVYENYGSIRGLREDDVSPSPEGVAFRLFQTGKAICRVQGVQAPSLQP